MKRKAAQSNTEKHWTMRPWGILATMLLAAATSLAQGPAATPQRPSLSSSAWTVPHGLFELEAGAVLSEGFGALPLFVKYGLRDSLELDIGIDAVRWVDGSGDTATSAGDLLLGARCAPLAATREFSWPSPRY